MESASIWAFAGASYGDLSFFCDRFIKRRDLPKGNFCIEDRVVNVFRRGFGARARKSRFSIMPESLSNSATRVNFGRKIETVQSQEISAPHTRKIDNVIGDADRVATPFAIRSSRNVGVVDRVSGLAKP
jgi:hypothetical protein